MASISRANVDDPFLDEVAVREAAVVEGAAGVTVDAT